MLDIDFIEIGLQVTYFLVAIGSLAAIILPLINAFSNPKALVRSFVALVLLGVLFAVSFTAANSDVTVIGTKEGLTAFGSQFIGAALILTYVLGALAILSILVTRVINLFR